MSNPIVETALKALKAPGYPTQNNRCQQWARMVLEAALGGKPMGTPNPASAKVAAERLVAAGKAVRSSDATKLQPGDLLYKTVGSGGAGHVGIYLGAHQVAENSTVHYRATGNKDARGIRTLKQFGEFQVVARFPVPVEAANPDMGKPISPAPKPAKPRILALNDGKQIRTVEGAVLVDGHWRADVVDTLSAQGKRYGVDAEHTSDERFVLKVSG